jgi:hypothetical protein
MKPKSNTNPLNIFTFEIKGHSQNQKFLHTSSISFSSSSMEEPWFRMIPSSTASPEDEAGAPVESPDPAEISGTGIVFPKSLIPGSFASMIFLFLFYFIFMYFLDKTIFVFLYMMKKVERERERERERESV